jgi:hypothetical protein
MIHGSALLIQQRALMIQQAALIPMAGGRRKSSGCIGDSSGPCRTATTGRRLWHRAKFGCNAAEDRRRQERIFGAVHVAQIAGGRLSEAEAPSPSVVQVERRHGRPRLLRGSRRAGRHDGGERVAARLRERQS